MLNAAGLLIYVALRFFAPVLWLVRKLAGAIRGLFAKGEPELSTGPYWQNVLGNQFSSPRSFERPDTRGALVAIVTSAKGRRVRAVGSGHSFSECAVTDDILVDMHSLKRVLAVDSKNRRVRVEAGISIRELNAQLAARKLALDNMGSYDIQTISGAISTATHGSGIAFGPLCEPVLSLELVVEGGRIFHIQPTGGTEPSPDYVSERVCDDDVFYSTVVAMGSMGIVYAYTLRVRDAFVLKETCELVEWPVVCERLEKGVLARHEHWEVLVNPYLVRRKRWCLVTTRDPIRDPARVAAPRTRRTMAALFTSVYLFDQIILWVLGQFPSQTPRLILTSLKSLVDKAYVSDSYKVYNLGDANLVPAFSSELGFPVEPLAPGDGAPFLAAAEKLFELADEEARHGRWHTVPVSLRFVRASNHYLAPQHGRATCMIEIPMLLGTRAGWDLLRYYERRLQPYGARPHWGQAHWLIGAENVRALYPKFPEWLAVFHRLNPNGTFDGPFTERLGLRAAIAGDTGARPRSGVRTTPGSASAETYVAPARPDDG